MIDKPCITAMFGGINNTLVIQTKQIATSDPHSLVTFLT